MAVGKIPHGFMAEVAKALSGGGPFQFKNEIGEEIIERNLSHRSLRSISVFIFFFLYIYFDNIYFNLVLPANTKKLIVLYRYTCSLWRSVLKSVMLYYIRLHDQTSSSF